MNDSTEFIYNQVETDYESSLEMFKNRIPADLAYLRRSTNQLKDAKFELRVSIPGAVMREALVSSDNESHVVASFRLNQDEESESRLGYAYGELFVEENGEKRILDAADLEAVQAAQVLRTVLMHATFRDDT